MIAVVEDVRPKLALVRFSNLQVGSFFLYAGKLYEKIAQTTQPLNNAVKVIPEGDERIISTWFGIDILIEPVTVKIEITGN